MDVETSTSMLGEDIAAVTVEPIAINVIVNGAFKGNNIGIGFGGVDPFASTVMPSVSLTVNVGGVVSKMI